jgi:hypothetical protein
MSAPNIVTHYWAKPIPDRQFDWSAHYDGDERNDDGQMMVGYGQTKEEAIIDLARLFTECAEAAEDRFYEKHRHLEALDQRIVACEACGTEGRVLVTMPGEWDPEDRGPCPYCEGTGGEIITTQPIEMADLDSEGAQ